MGLFFSPFTMQRHLIATVATAALLTLAGTAQAQTSDLSTYVEVGYSKVTIKADDIGLKTINDRASLLAGAAMRLFDNQLLAGFFQPDFGKMLIDIAIKLTGRVIRHVQQPHFFFACGCGLACSWGAASKNSVGSNSAGNRSQDFSNPLARVDDCKWRRFGLTCREKVNNCNGLLRNQYWPPVARLRQVQIYRRLNIS